MCTLDITKGNEIVTYVGEGEFYAESNEYFYYDTLDQQCLKRQFQNIICLSAWMKMELVI
jgi:hypothetical protein